MEGWTDAVSFLCPPIHYDEGQFNNELWKIYFSITAQISYIMDWYLLHEKNLKVSIFKKQILSNRFLKMFFLTLIYFFYFLLNYLLHTVFQHHYIFFV